MCETALLAQPCTGRTNKQRREKNLLLFALVDLEWGALHTKISSTPPISYGIFGLKDARQKILDPPPGLMLSPNLPSREFKESKCIFFPYTKCKDVNIV